jgi:hypothetical protein
MRNTATKTYNDGLFTYSIGDAFDDYLIIESGVPEEEYIEVHKDDCSKFEREIYDFLYKMEQA